MNGHILASDHIATAVLAGVGFAVIENILYIYYLFDNSLIQISIVRLLTNSIVHGLFTGLIGYGIFQFLNQKLPAKKLFFLLLFSLTGIGSHVLYNYSMSQSRIAIGFIFVIV
jgi:RsiW-degrading membrane proteinase PrsW (M82 family)